MSEERKSRGGQPLEQERVSAAENDTDDLAGNDDLERLVRQAQAAVRQNRAEKRGEEPEEQVLLDEEVPSATTEDFDVARAEFDEKIARLEKDLAERDEEVGQLKDRLLRLAAEFDNFKKRSRKERNDLVQFANEELLKQFLPVLDNFERALEAASQQEIPESFFKGIELIHSQAVNILERIGLKPIESVGKPFDPNVHEAVMREASVELPENVVVQEFRRGYSLNDKIVRQAMVSVSSRPPDAAEAGPPGQAAAAEEASAAAGQPDEQEDSPAAVEDSAAESGQGEEPPSEA